MRFLRPKAELPEPGGTLPGRDEPMPVPAAHLVLGTPLTPPFPESTERALFGMGSFWGADRRF